RPPWSVAKGRSAPSPDHGMRSVWRLPSLRGAGLAVPAARFQEVVSKSDARSILRDQSIRRRSGRGGADFRQPRSRGRIIVHRVYPGGCELSLAGLARHHGGPAVLATFIGPINASFDGGQLTGKCLIDIRALHRPFAASLPDQDLCVLSHSVQPSI